MREFSPHPVSRDSRYVIALEYCGSGDPRYVLRFGDEVIDTSRFYSPLVLRAVGHYAITHGAPVIEEVRANG